MAKVQLISFTRKLQSEYEACVSLITNTQDIDIDITARFPTQQDADAWITEFEDLLDGCSVSMPDATRWDFDIEQFKEKQDIFISLKKRVQELEKLLHKLEENGRT